MWGSWEHLSPRRNAENRFVSLRARSLCKSNVWRICLWFHFRRFVLVPWLPINLENNNSWSKPSENLQQGGLRGLGLHLWVITAPPVTPPRQPGHLISQNSNWETDIVLFLVCSTHTTPSAWALINLYSRFNFSTVASNSCFPNLIQRDHSSSPDEWAGTSEPCSRNLWFPHTYIWPLEGSAGPAKSLGALLHLRPHLGRPCRI